jgi:hypothetical protein
MISKLVSSDCRILFTISCCESISKKYSELIESYTDQLELVLMSDSKKTLWKIGS